MGLEDRVGEIIVEQLGVDADDLAVFDADPQTAGAERADENDLATVLADVDEAATSGERRHAVRPRRGPGVRTARPG